jgi:hypothetical protein
MNSSLSTPDPLLRYDYPRIQIVTLNAIFRAADFFGALKRRGLQAIRPD